MTGIPLGLAILSMGLFPSVTHAESSPSDTLVGSRVRVKTTSAAGRIDRIVAKVVEEDERTLTLDREESAGRRVVVQRSTVTSLERSSARSRKGHGAILGLLIGGATGVILGYAAGDDSGGSQFCTFDGCASFGPFVPSRPTSAALLGMTLGAIGAGVGALVSPGERWQRAPHQGIHLSVAPVAGGGLGARLSLSFSRLPHRSD